MKNLIIPRNTISFLESHGISAKKRFGQNFLIDGRVLGKIIAGAEIGKEDSVLEIGPGIGTMTQALCEAAGHVTAVEIDGDMIPLLKENLSDYQNYEILHEDILKADLRKLMTKEAEACPDGAGTDTKTHGAPDKQEIPESAAEPAKIMKTPLSGDTPGRNQRLHPWKVVANLPYYITTPILMALLEEELPIDSITVMVQKEVAERMQAKPGTKDYGALTLAVEYYADAEIIARVPSNCFIPRPGVDSAVIRLKCHEIKPVQPADPKWMFRLIRASFAQRRKTLANALKNAPDLKDRGLTREEMEAVLSAMGLDPAIRGERLSLKQFAELSERLANKTKM